jgi:hypothetical protein
MQSSWCCPRRSWRDSSCHIDRTRPARRCSCNFRSDTSRRHCRSFRRRRASRSARAGSRTRPRCIRRWCKPGCRCTPRARSTAVELRLHSVRLHHSELRQLPHLRCRRSERPQLRHSQCRRLPPLRRWPNPTHLPNHRSESRPLPQLRWRRRQRTRRLRRADLRLRRTRYSSRSPRPRRREARCRAPERARRRITSRPKRIRNASC